MKKIIVSAVIGILIINSFTLITTSENNEIIDLISEQIHISKPQIFARDNYLSIKIKEAGTFDYEPGKPLIPVIIKTYIFPFGTKIKNIKIDYNTINISLSKKIYPASYPSVRYNNLFQKNLDLKEVNNLYENLKIYPYSLYEISQGSGLKNGEHVLFLNIRINPQYIPKEDILITPKDVKIYIEYSQPFKSKFFSDEYDMVIISPEIFSSDLQKLIDHKNNVGVSTFLKTAEDIYDEYSGVDKPEQIKYFIKDAIEELGIKYVLFIGDVNLLPIRKTLIKMDLPLDNTITDLYYADIYDLNGNFSSWDSNNNGVFGEFKLENFYPPGDIIDLYPDIMTGRIPCSDRDQLNIVINKIIKYETNTNGEDWFKNFILMGGDTFPQNDFIEGEMVTNIIGEYMENYEYITEKLWTSMNTFKPRIINEIITNGAGFVSYSGHGYEQGFGTSPPQVERRIEYFSPYLIGMKNEDKLPIIFLDACSTTKLDFTINDLKEWYPLPMVMILSVLSGLSFDNDNLYPCFSWELVKKQNGGAIISMGSTRIAFLGMDMDGNVIGGIAFLNIKFFESYKDDMNIGYLFNSAISSYINDAGWKEPITPQEFILIGDPSLKIGGYS